MRRARWTRRRRWLLTGVAVLAAGLALISHATGLWHRTELQTIDARFSVRGSQPQLLKNLLVVGVDDATFSRFDNQKVPDQWPFPRREHARVIDNLVKAGAKEIAVDIQFTEPSDNTDDTDLEEAILHARHVVLATTEVGAHGSTNVFGGNANLWNLLGHSIAANATVVFDSDGSLRRMQYEYQGLESFAPAIAAESGDKNVTPTLFGGDTTPQPIDYAGPPGTAPYLSYWQIYDNKFPASMVRGKIVIIGATAPTLQDLHVTPTSGSTGGSLMSGPEIQANAVATVLHGIPLRDGAGWVNVLLIVLLGSVAPVLGIRGWAVKALAGAVAVGLLYLLAAQLTFNSGRIIAVVDPLFALALGALGTLAVVYLGEAFERQYARSTFARFVPPDVVDQVLASSDDDLRLAGVERVCTVMFSDLRGFTSFSQSQPVDRVIAVVNHYLGEMSEAIMDQGGTLISYMGDGIMAVFGAPLEQDDHADRALRAAREMIGPRLEGFNQWLEDQGYPAGLRMGVGLNSGSVMCGNVGAEQRVEYTAIGDTTNTASRLEGMTKGQPHMLFIAESTRDLMSEVPDDMVFVGEFEVRGKESKIRIHSVPDPDGAPALS
jgi:adenylate cyclase